MRLYIVIFVFLATICKLNATHMAGADVRYVHLSGSTYKVIAKVYRLCNGIALNGPTGTAFVSDASGTSCGNVSLSYTRTAIKDIGVYCSTEKKCNPANTWVTSTGFEEHTYEVTVNLGSSAYTSLISGTCNIVTFSISQCCRDNTITTAKNDVFMATATLFLGNLNLLSNKTNTSPEFKSRPMVNYCCNMPVTQDFEAADTTNGDVLRYKLVPALSAFGISVSYNGSWSGKYPVTPYCPGFPGKLNCSPVPYTNFPVGIFLDTSNGEFIYTPTNCNEVAPVCVEVSEYRRVGSKLILVGMMRRDILFRARDCGKNKAPEILSDYEYGVCLGDTLCFEVKTRDTALNNSNNYDTLQMNWSCDIGKAVITSSNPNGREPVLKFCWVSTNQDFRAEPYRLKLEVRDQNCPVPSLTFRNIKIKTLKSTTVSVKTIAQACNRRQFSAQSSVALTNATFDWLLRDSAGGDTLLVSKTTSPVTGTLDAGTYYVSLKVNSKDFCEIPEIFDTIRIQNPAPGVSLPGDTNLCERQPVTITAVVSGASKPYSYIWFMNEDTVAGNNSVFNVKTATGADTFSVKVTDSLGCVMTDEMVISGRALPLTHWSNDTLPGICFTGANEDLSQYLADTLNLLSLFVNTGDTVGAVPVNGKWMYQLSRLTDCVFGQNGTSVPVYLLATDSTGCSATDTAIVNVSCLPEWSLKDDTVCQTSTSYYYLKDLAGSDYETSGYSYDFKLLEYPSGVDSISVISDNSGNGTNWKFFAGFHRSPQRFGSYSVAGCKTNAITGCRVCDTSVIEVSGTSQYQLTRKKVFCTNIRPIDIWPLILRDGAAFDGKVASLSVLALNGDTNRINWGGASLEDNRWLEHADKSGKWLLQLSEIHEGCTFSDTFSVMVYPSPLAAFTTNPADSALTTSPKFQTSNQSSISDASTLLYTWDPGTGNVNDRSNAISPQFTYPANTAAYSIMLEARSNKGCRDTAFHFVYIYEKNIAVDDIAVNAPLVNSGVQLLGVDFTTIKRVLYNSAGQKVAELHHNEAFQAIPGLYQYVIIWSDKEGAQHVFKGKVLVP